MGEMSSPNTYLLCIIFFRKATLAIVLWVHADSLPSDFVSCLSAWRRSI